MTADYRAELQHLLTAVENDVIDTNDGLRFQAAANRARAALAQPEPQGASDEALANFTAWFCRNYPGPDTIIHKPEWHAPKVFRAAADALARWGRPAIDPVPVSERPWEREGGWCDLDGECWWCPPYSAVLQHCWVMVNPARVDAGWLLPAHALPIPAPKGCETGTHPV